MIGTQKHLFDEQPEPALSRLSAYAKEHGLSNGELAQEIGVSYHTLKKWYFFTERKDVRNPSEEYLATKTHRRGF